jgi:hypothetical protein
MFQSLLTAPVQVIGAACAVCAAPSTVSPAISAAAAVLNLDIPVIMACP